MRKISPWRSLDTRFVACLMVAGLMLCAWLGVLEYAQAKAAVRLHVTQHIHLATRNVQAILRNLLNDPAPTRGQLRHALHGISAQSPVTAVRLVGANLRPMTLGRLADGADTDAEHLLLADDAAATLHDISLSRPTLIEAPFHTAGRPYDLRILVDGPAAAAAAGSALFHRLLTQTLLLSIVALLALLLLRRSVLGPLLEHLRVTEQAQGPSAFCHLADHGPMEFRRLAIGTAAMVERLAGGAMAPAGLPHEATAGDDAASRVGLLRLAPGDGRILEANERMAAMLELADAQSLVGQCAADFLCPKDRPLLRQTLDRLAGEEHKSIEFSLHRGQRTLRVAAEAAAQYDERGALQSVRLALMDISLAHQLHRRAEDQSRLLHQVFNHLSEAVMLVDPDGRIVAVNQRLGQLLHCDAGELVGRAYQREHFWDALEVKDRAQFASRLEQIEADAQRPSQHRFETPTGPMIFRGVPALDPAGAMTGRLWVISDAPPAQSVEQAAAQQYRQRYVARRVSHALSQVYGARGVIQGAAEQLFEHLGVDAAGVAIRMDQAGHRSRQIIHRGAQHRYLLEPHQRLVEMVERALMPEVLPQNDVVYWPDLPAQSAWGKAFSGAGLTCVAAGPLHGSRLCHGVVWIARRGGERLSHEQLHLFETLLPLIATRLDVVDLEEHLQRLELTDAGTELPTRHQFARALDQVCEGHDDAAVFVLEVDQLRRLIAGSGRDADQVLRVIAQRINRLCRRSTVLARLDETRLGLIAKGLTPDDAASLGERLRQSVSRIAVHLPDRPPMHLTLSIGLATRGQDDPDAHNLWVLAGDRADLARRAGRDRVVSHGLRPVRQAG